MQSDHNMYVIFISPQWNEFQTLTMKTQANKSTTNYVFISGHIDSNTGKKRIIFYHFYV